MTLRRCLRCRKSLSTKQLIPLHSGAGGSLLVGRPSSGRGGWICPGCILPAVEHPQVFSRCFRTSISGVEHIPGLAREWLRNQCVSWLRLALRNGLVDSSPNQTQSDPFFIVRSNGHKSPNSSNIESEDNQPQTFVLDISSRDLGDILSKGPRSEVRIKPGRSTQSLLQSLRGWASLG